MKIDKKWLIILMLSLSVEARQQLLPEIALYAATLNEYPDIDNDNWYNPVFTSLYHSQKQSFFSKVFNFTGLRSYPFSIAMLENILNDVLADREQLEVGGDGEIVQKIFPEPDAKFVVFGDLQGAFHSFIRDLQKLVQLNVLSNDLEIAEKCYFIFNGNVINGSPYNAETLFLVLQLMKRNPSKVIYIQGRKEMHYEKSESPLSQQIKAVSGANNEVLDQRIEKFFNTLPLALYIMNDEKKGIRVDANTNKQFTDEMISSFLATRNKPWITTFQKIDKREVPVEIMAIVTVDNNYKTVGLKRHIDYLILWSIFSSPIGAHRRLYGFVNDAFAIIDITPYIKNWNIVFYHNDALRGQPFGPPSAYNLISGDLLYGNFLNFFDQKEREQLKENVYQLEERVKRLKEECQKKQQAGEKNGTRDELIDQNKRVLLAVHDDVIVFGCTLDLSKGLRNQSAGLQAGITAKIDEINALGGVNGKQLQIIFLDDEYTPSIAKKNALRFINEFNTDVLLCPLGSSTLEIYLDMVKEEKILVLFPVTGSLMFRSPEIKNILNYRPSYSNELQTLTEYMVMVRNARKFLIFYQQDSYGEGPKEAVKATLRRLNITNFTEIPYERNELDFTDKVKQIKNFDPDSIVFISTSVPAQNLIRQLGADFFSGKNIYGTSNNFGEASFKNFMKLKGLNFFIANVVPNPEVSDTEIAKEFRNKAYKGNIVIDTISFEGYILASLTVYVLEQIKGEITKQKIIDVIRGMKDFDFKGLKLSYNPELNTLSNDLWISEGFDEKWLKVNLKPLDILTDAHKQQDQVETKTPQVSTANDNQSKVVVDKTKVVVDKTITK